MEIEVGDFVRTKKGYIAKVSQTDNGYVFSEDTIDMSYEECRGYVDKRDIVKHSKQLLDLIEVGDYVNGLEVHKGRVANGKEKLLVGNYLINGMALEVINIKTILTHEQFERNCYRLEE